MTVWIVLERRWSNEFYNQGFDAVRRVFDNFEDAIEYANDSCKMIQKIMAENEEYGSTEVCIEECRSPERNYVRLVVDDICRKYYFTYEIVSKEVEGIGSDNHC